ncbi:YqjF family protein [Haloplanus sp.]|uniref:YqjF family protein n=1 Tax=Haloplanus sp. TaxID=1961696 RepID=UPI002624D853|nr:DUF2071 domain-containing protein [Haloplanus sp.]
MPTVLTVTGCDVLFAHWPVDPETVDPHVPDALDVVTFDGSAWVSVLALENHGVGPGPIRLPRGLERGIPQLNLRTYVTAGGRSGVYFLSLDTDSRAAVTAGRRAFGLPFHRARMRTTRRDGTITFRSRRTDSEAAFQARYRPVGEPYRAERGSIESFCIEEFHYLFPGTEDRRRRASGDRDSLRVGTIDREPWTLRPVEATIRRNTLFEAAGLPTPPTDPVTQYAPTFEMRVEPVESVSVSSEA